MAGMLGKIILGVLAVIIILGLVGALVLQRVGTPVRKEIRILNEGGQGKALVVYHPGLTALQRKVTEAFSEGLASTGRRVEITTASPEAPSDVSGYELLVFGGPTYGNATAKPLREYIEGLTMASGTPAVVIATAGGDASGNAWKIRELVESKGGVVTKTLTYLTSEKGASDEARLEGESMG